MQIDVSLDVYKELTARLQHEGHTYSDVIRELLALDSPVEPEPVARRHPLDISTDVSREFAKLIGYTGFYSRDLNLPNGTQLRARYKQRLYRARIENDEWLDEQGVSHTSPSAAASAITGTNVNGLRFWEASRPGETSWRRLETLVER